MRNKGFSQDRFELSSLTNWSAALPSGLGRARALQRSPRPPSGPGTGARHVALLLLAAAAAPAGSVASDLLSPLTQRRGPGAGRGFLCASNSLMLHLQGFILNFKKESGQGWEKQKRPGCCFYCEMVPGTWWNLAPALPVPHQELPTAFSGARVFHPLCF